MPGLDSLQCYKVKSEGDDVYITTTEEQLKNPKRHRPMAKHNAAADARVFVVIGGGTAGSAAVESIRASGFQGRVVMLSKEATLPVDRVKLSKSFSPDVNVLQLRPPEFYKDIDVEVHLEATVTSLDNAKKMLAYSDKAGALHELKYDSVLVATGGSPMSLKLDGAKSENVFLIRTLADSKRVGEAAAKNPKANVVVIGSNFIGMEAAAALSKLVASVTVVSRGPLPFRPFGPEIGKACLNFFVKNGVHFKADSEPVRLNVVDNKVTSVVLSDGSELPCDFMVCGVGVEAKSTTSFISGVNVESNGAIKVDAHLQAAPNFFVAGDIALYPDPMFGSIRVEHWAVAGSQGKIAGANMVHESSGSMTPYTTMPYFFTMNFGKGIRYCGYASSWDEIIFDMEPNGFEPDVMKFAAFYVKGGRVVAVASAARDPIVSRSAEFLKFNQMPTPDALKAAIKGGRTINHFFV